MEQSFSHEAAAPSAHDAQMIFRIGLAFSEGWNAMKAHYGLLLGSLVIFIIIQVAIGIAVSVLEHVNVGVGFILDVFTMVFVMPHLQAGLMYLGVRAFRRETFGVNALFAGFSRYWTIVGIQILVGVLIFACMLPGIIVLILGFVLMQFAEIPGMVIVILGGATMALGAIVIVVRLAFAFYACLDPANGRAGVIDSIKLSWRMTSPIAGRLLVLFFLVGLMVLGTLLLLIVGALFLGGPLAIAVYGSAYCLAFAMKHAAIPFDNVAPPNDSPHMPDPSAAPPM